MGCVYPRKNKLWIRYKAADGKWTQQKTSLHVGDEKKARRILLDVEARIKAGVKFDPLNASASVTVAAYARQWLGERRHLVADAGNDEARLKYHILPAIGGLLLEEVRPRHLVEMIRALRNSGKLAPKSIYNVYSTLKALFRDAKIEDLLTGDLPTILTKYQLGDVADKDPEWRATARYSREELEILISDPRLPLDRRVFYALEGIAGLRLGEAAGLRFRHYDPSLQPLGCLLIATSYDTGRTKTKQPRRMPAHPTLAAILAEWKLSGWAAMMGRQPTPDDLIVPMPPDAALRRRSDWTPEGMRNKSYCFKRFREDLERLGFRHRRGHDMRRTMVSLSREDGARKDILELCTHNPKKTGSSIDVYTTFPWEALCGEVAKLRIQRRTPDNIVALRAAVAATGAFDDDRPEPDPPAPPPRSGGPRNRGLARSLATPLATLAADSKGIRGDARWRRRESNSTARRQKISTGAPVCTIIARTWTIGRQLAWGRLGAVGTAAVRFKMARTWLWDASLGGATGGSLVWLTPLTRPIDERHPVRMFVELTPRMEEIIEETRIQKEFLDRRLMQLESADYAQLTTRYGECLNTLFREWADEWRRAVQAKFGFTPSSAAPLIPSG